MAFIDAHRAEYGVEPICSVLPIAPSTYYEYKARQADPSRLPPRVRRDAVLGGGSGSGTRISGLWRREGLKQLRRERITAARCTVGGWCRVWACRGRCGPVVQDDNSGAIHRRRRSVQRQFEATRPNQLWSRFTYGLGGFVFVAFVIDVFSRRIVGWRSVGLDAHRLVLDALEQALYSRGQG